MPTYVALLRGINLAGRNKVAMADLRDLCERLGLDEVRTHVQSGNVVFSSSRGSTTRMATQLTRQMGEDLDVEPSVIVVPADEFIAIADDNPYQSEADDDPTRVHLAVLPDGADLTAFEVDADEYAPERVTAGERVLYLHLPDGIGRSRLATDLMRRDESGAMTVRNWRTVSRLVEMAGGGWIDSGRPDRPRVSADR